MSVTYMIGSDFYTEHCEKSELGSFDELVRSENGVIVAVRED